MAFVFFKLFLYILILLSLSLQTTARRSQMLPNGTITTTNTDIPPSNDTESALTNDNNSSSPTGTDDTEPTFTNDNNIISPTGTNDNESALTNDNNIISPTGTNDTESAFTNDDATPTPTNANDNDTPYPETTAPQTDQDFFTPDPENANDTSSTPPRKENDVVFSPTPTPKVAPVSPLSPPPPLDLGDYYQNDMSFSPVPAPSADHSSDGDFFDYENSPDPSAAPDTDDYDGDWTAPAAAKPTVLPSTYEADDEVDPELAAEIEAYTAARERNSRALVVVLGFACLVGVGGFVYKKRKQDMAKKSQYQYLSKRDENEL